MEKQLVSFGNYLLKTYGVKFPKRDGVVSGEQREVTDADLRNWKEENKPIYEIYSFESNEWVECDKYEFDKTEDKYRRELNQNIPNT